MADSLSAVLRVVSFVFLLTATGSALFWMSFRHLLSSTHRWARRFALKMTFAAIVAVSAHHALEAARMAGELNGALDPAMQTLSLQTTGGAAFAARMAGLVLLAVGLKWELRPLQVIGPIAVAGGFALTGHTAVSPHRAFAAAFLVVHVLIVAFWAGSLWPLYRAAAEEAPPAAARLIQSFSSIASWLVPLIPAAGVALAVLLLPDVAVLREPYGRLLLVKAALFAVLMGLAGLNKYRLGPACASGDARAFRSSVLAEYAIICAVLAVTAVMTMLYSPEAP